MAFVCINRLEDGTICHSDHGLIKIGEYRGSISPRLRQVVGLFNAGGIRCQAIDDLARGRWEKLVWNIPFNGLGALLGLSTDKLVQNEAGLALVRNIMQDVIKVAASCGIILASDIVEQNIRHTLTMGAYRSSSQVDAEHSRPVEIQAILQIPPLSAARANKIATPYLEMLYNQLSVMQLARA